MNNIVIVPFNEKYIDDIFKISTMSFITPWTRKSTEEELQNKFARYVVAKLGDVVIGFGGVWLILDEGHITNIAVHPEYRGIGAGDMIVEALIEICRLEGINSMTLEVRKSNIAAQALYKKHGFIEKGIRKGYYTDTKEDGIIMWKFDLSK
ncbi:ribosomal protein S18-alanine N-acetyltransferase [Clostridium sp. SYSU_GA19001]|uniref:ribosomal protein S18-alanine N-acetyltransferase n=1 Tax=Clostridium caldaquaticum TaxID=2940653 RepID=UPI0020777D76|nr:ribosomal protein S18-alanine N-acetyltransferase [Clostridium caldaquaticum]MCM8709759.1 ribosomal protein S18-alanine N-acetyltransferase [Clostridium caldaquaticum]